jgi:Family of unknown function (DUF6157)
MKTHTTNYTNTFIEVAEDCPVKEGEIPPVKGDKQSIANMQFDMISRNPYKYTSDDVIFYCHATKNEIPKTGLKAEREAFFSKGQPCLRASPLTKRYGWGIHSDEAGKVAMYALGTTDYRKRTKDKSLTVVKAMRSKKA